MTSVGITGWGGFVGTHLRFFLNEHKDDHEVVLIDKNDFLCDEKLLEKLKKCDTVVHLAGLNRGDEEEVYKTNIELTKKLLEVCEKINKKPKIIFLSSIHNIKDTGYGRSKRDCENMLVEWGEKNKAKTVSVISPNLFGEFAKPNYNTFIGTFCCELIERKESKVNESARVELLYVRDICSLIFDLMDGQFTKRTVVCHGKEVNIGKIYSLLRDFRDEYFSGVISSLNDCFEINLFNTLRSYLYPKYLPTRIDVKKDDRGSFVEIIREKNGGQTSFSITYPGIIRGNHYHTRKIERFCVIKGNATIRLRKLFSDDVIEYKVSGELPVYIDIPTYFTHSIENTGHAELLTVFWTNELFDLNDPDTVMEPVILKK